MEVAWLAIAMLGVIPELTEGGFNCAEPLYPLQEKGRGSVVVCPSKVRQCLAATLTTGD